MSRDCRERVTKGNSLDSRGSVEYSESYLVFYSFILSCLICLFISEVHCCIIMFACRNNYFISGLNFDTKLRREFSYFILFYCSHILFVVIQYFRYDTLIIKWTSTRSWDSYNILAGNLNLTEGCWGQGWISCCYSGSCSWKWRGICLCRWNAQEWSWYNAVIWLISLRWTGRLHWQFCAWQQVFNGGRYHLRWLHCNSCCSRVIQCRGIPWLHLLVPTRPFFYLQWSTVFLLTYGEKRFSWCEQVVSITSHIEGHVTTYYPN